MDSKYLKDLEEEIKERKTDNLNYYDLNLPSMKKKKEEKENSDMEQSQNQYEQEEEIEPEQEQDIEQEQEQEQEQELEQEQEQEQEQNDIDEQSQNNNNLEEDEDNDIVNEGIKSLVSDENKKIEKNEEKINYDLPEINMPKTNSKISNIISVNSFSVCQ